MTENERHNILNEILENEIKRSRNFVLGLWAYAALLWLPGNIAVFLYAKLSHAIGFGMASSILIVALILELLRLQELRKRMEIRSNPEGLTISL